MSHFMIVCTVLCCMRRLSRTRTRRSSQCGAVRCRPWGCLRKSHLQGSRKWAGLVLGLGFDTYEVGPDPALLPLAMHLELPVRQGGLGLGLSTLLEYNAHAAVCACVGGGFGRGQRRREDGGYSALAGASRQPLVERWGRVDNSVAACRSDASAAAGVHSHRRLSTSGRRTCGSSRLL